METNQHEFTGEEEYEYLIEIPENKRPPMEAEVLQVQESQPVSGVSSNIEEAIPENMGRPLQSEIIVQQPQTVSQSVGSSTVKPRSDKSTKKKKQPKEEAAAEGGKRKRRDWSEAAVIALMNAHQRQSEQNLTNIDWNQIANYVNASQDSDKPRTSNNCLSKFERLQTNWSEESSLNPIIKTKGLKEWYLETDKPAEWDINSINALLDAHWEILQRKILSGSTALLFQDSDYELLAEKVKLCTGVITTGKQCCTKIGNLTYQYRKGASKWPYFEKVKRFVDAKTAGGSTSNDGAPQSAGPRIAHR